MRLFIRGVLVGVDGAVVGAAVPASTAVESTDGGGGADEGTVDEGGVDASDSVGVVDETEAAVRVTGPGGVDVHAPISPQHSTADTANPRARIPMSPACSAT